MIKKIPFSDDRGWYVKAKVNEIVGVLNKLLCDDACPVCDGDGSLYDMKRGYEIPCSECQGTGIGTVKRAGE